MDSSAKRGENITLDPDSSRKALDTKPPPNSCSTVSGVSLEKTSSNPAPKQSTTPPISSLSSLVSNPFNDIRQVRIVNDDTLEVVYANPKDKQPDNGRASISVAAITTCLARHKLYEALEQLQQRVLYFGTDSVIYATEPGQPNIPLGDLVGDMTNKLDDGDFITEFTSAGPKNYGYKTNQGKVCCKVRYEDRGKPTMTSCDKIS